MGSKLPSDRSDEQLEAIFCETANWAVLGRGQVLCVAASLERAIQRAAEYSLSDAVVTEISTLPRGDIRILAPQINRLRQMIFTPMAVPAE